MAEITVSVPNSTFTVTTPATGFTVTTPTNQVIEVGGVGQSIDIVSTPVNVNVNEVGVTNTDQLIEGTTNLFYTNARVATYLTANEYATESYVDAAIGMIDYPVDSVNGQTGAVVLTTTNINEGTNLYYTTSRANSDFDSRLATKSTSNLAEGTNLYYTSGRANTDFDTRLATKSTTNLAEGTNLYYTTARANSDFDTRLATKTTTNLAEGTNLYYTTTRANTDFDSRLATKTTDNLNEGTTNRYFANSLARQAVSVSDTGGDGSLSYDNSTGVITYTGPSATEVRAHFTAGTGVSITNGQIAIGQAVATNSAVQFSSVQLDNVAVVDTATLTTTATTADQILDSWSAATYRTAKYQIQIASGTDYQAVEILVVHNGTTATQVVYADVRTGANLAAFAADINSGSVRLLTTPVNAATTYKVVRTALTA
jgi:hypothetical protein